MSGWVLDKIDELVNSKHDDLTTWELEFLESVRDDLEAGRLLSSRRKEVLDDLMEKYLK